jgi:uncharacterized membrane protein
MDPLHVGATWLHAVAMTFALGYYAVLGWVAIPVLERLRAQVDPGEAVAAIERRALPVIVGAIAVFTASGLVLMVGDGRYDGLGNVTASTWTILMLLKHVVVAVMVGLGLTLHVIATRDPAEALQRRRPVQRLAQVIAALGAVVLLITAAAQDSA